MRGSFYPNLGLRYTGEVEIGVGKEKMSILGLSFSGKDRTIVTELNKLTSNPPSLS